MKECTYTEYSLTAPALQISTGHTGEWELLTPIPGYFGNDAAIFTDSALIDLTSEHYFADANKSALSDRMKRIFFGTIGRIILSHPESNVFFIGIDIGYRFLDVVYFHGTKRKKKAETTVFVGYGLPGVDMVTPENADILTALLKGEHVVEFKNKPPATFTIQHIDIRAQPEMAIFSQMIDFDGEMLSTKPDLLNGNHRPGAALVGEIGSKTAHAGVYRLEAGKYTGHHMTSGEGLWSLQPRWAKILADKLYSRMGSLPPEESLKLLESGTWKDVDLSAAKEQLAQEYLAKYTGLFNASWDHAFHAADTSAIVLFGRGVLLFDDLLFEHYAPACSQARVKMLIPEQPGLAVARGSALTAVAHWWKRKDAYFEVS